MRARIKRILAAAAVLAAGGAALDQALREANRDDAEPVTCVEWEAALAEMGGTQIEFFLLGSSAFIQGGVPTASSSRVVGECAAGECVIPTPCKSNYRYPFDVGPAVEGWRLARVYAHPYIAGAWQKLAAEVGDDSLRYWSVRSEVVSSCVGLLTADQCRDLLRGVDDCWLRTDGAQCRGGLLYGPGLGGVNADGSPATCTVQASDTWVACSDANRGKGWALRSCDAPAPEVLDLRARTSPGDSTGVSRGK